MVMKAGHSWNGNGAAGFVKGIAWEGILRATVYFWQQCQQTLNVSNPHPYKTPSLPGEPPRKRTGFGQSSVTYETDKASLTTRVGILSVAKYMATLELFRNRPWLLATLKKTLPMLQAMVRPQR